MVHLDVPGPDEGVFSTEEVRSRDETHDATSRTIAFPKNHYKEPPHVAGGFKLLDLSHEAPIRANLCGSDLTQVGRVQDKLGDQALKGTGLV